MRRSRLSWLTLAAVVAMASTLRADSNPQIAGFVAGLELCPQSICGSAVFAGRFVGRVDGRLAFGTFLGAINHDPLPEPYETASITGGQWLIWTWRNRFEGVAPRGTLTNNGDNTFTVVLNMVLTDGGVGTITFTGLLDHNVFPPTIAGTITP